MPATITCPKCGGQGYDGIEEGSNAHCGTTGRIPVEQAINNMWESACGRIAEHVVHKHAADPAYAEAVAENGDSVIDARAEASEAERLSEKGIPF